MAGINKVTLIGHLGQDPEVKVLDGGHKVAKFSLATTDTYKDKNTNEFVDTVEWHRIILWRHDAEKAEKFLKKGSKIYLEGKIKYGSYEKDGSKVYTTDIVGSLIRLLDGKKEEPQAEPTPTPQSPDMDELPF